MLSPKRDSRSEPLGAVIASEWVPIRLVTEKCGYRARTETFMTEWERVLKPLNVVNSGSIANLSSAAAVAVSSFEMKVRDPQPFINKIDWALFDRMRSQGGV